MHVSSNSQPWHAEIHFETFDVVFSIMFYFSFLLINLIES
eukprot:UN04372